MKKFVVIAAIAALSITAFGCASADEQPKPDPAVAAQMQQQIDDLKAKTEDLKAKNADNVADTTDAPKASEPTVEDASVSGKVRVPNVVGMDHQLAQDTMQAAGLYMLDEVDCTGQDRMLIIDRNWTVQKQTPAAGKRVSADSTITLCSVKDGE
jgi:hypothetical protein